MNKRIVSSLLLLVMMIAMLPLQGSAGIADQVTVTRPENAVSKTVLLEDWKIASSSVDVTATLPVIPEVATDAAVAAPGFSTDMGMKIKAESNC